MHILLQLRHQVRALSERKNLLFGFCFVVFLSFGEGFQADAVFFTDHGVVETEWSVLL